MQLIICIQEDKALNDLLSGFNDADIAMSSAAISDVKALPWCAASRSSCHAWLGQGYVGALETVRVGVAVVMELVVVTEYVKQLLALAG